MNINALYWTENIFFSFGEVLHVFLLFHTVDTAMCEKTLPKLGAEFILSSFKLIWWAFKKSEEVKLLPY